MSFALGSASSMQRVFRDRPFDGPVGKPLELAAAMNGWTSGQVVIMAGGKGLRDVRVEVKDLKSWEVSEHPTAPPLHALVEGPSMPAEAFKVSRVQYVEITQPSSGKITRPGWYPDPLEPLTPESRFDVEPGMVQPIWLALKVPPDTRARNHSLYRRWYRLFRGSVVVHADVEGEGRQSQELDIELRVFKFSLPRRRLRIWTMISNWAEFYNWLSPEELHESLKRMAFLLGSYGITSSMPAPPRAEGEPPDLDYFERVYKKLLDMGVSHLQINPDTWPIIVKNGWEDIAYMYVGGEWPREDNIENAKRIRKVIAKVPLVKTQAALVHPSPHLDDLIKVWVYSSDDSSDSLKERLAQGDEAQWYSCCWPDGAYPNCMLDCAPVDPRIICWQAFQYNISGYLYWNASHVAPHGPDQEKHEGQQSGREVAQQALEPLHNRAVHQQRRAAHLPRPGRRALEQHPAGKPARRRRRLRLPLHPAGLRGEVEEADFSPELVDRAEQTLKVSPEVSACKTEYTGDPAVVERERRRVCAYIEEARGTLGEIGPIFPSGFSSEK